MEKNDIGEGDRGPVACFERGVTIPRREAPWSTKSCVHELQRIEGRRGLVTMCIGGGQGIALALERIN